jgi:hypothetical protein
MNTLGIVIGNYSRSFAEKTDNKRITAREQELSELAKQARIERTSLQIQKNMIFEEEEGTLYGAGIAD